MLISLDKNQIPDEYRIPNDYYTGVSYEAEIVYDQLFATKDHLARPLSRQSGLQKFYNITATWQDKAINKSSITEIVMTSEYLEIIGMGMPIVPLILMELKNKPDHWFWALNAITGENPVKKEHRGVINHMVEDWLQWGKENGLI